MRHTPGPWTVKIIDTISDEPAYWQIIDTHGGVVGDVQSVNAADARLIAAAPDLLAALQALTAVCENEGFPYLDNILRMSRSAIARATT